MLSVAVAAYHDTHKRYPPAYLVDANGTPMHSWRVLILPYLSAPDLHKEYRFDEPWDGPNNRKLAPRMPRVFALHGEERPGNETTNYLAVVGPETVWRPDEGLRLEDITDGTGNTILFVENLGANVHWMEPRDLLFADMDFTIDSPNGIKSKYHDPAVAMVDSMLYRLTRDVTPPTLRAMLTVNGGEKLAHDEKAGWFLLEDGRQRPLR